MNHEYHLLWNDTALAYVVRVHGGTEEGDWTLIWNLALELCRGWHVKALQSAARFACAAVIRDIAQHPDATGLTAGAWHDLMLHATHQTDPKIFEALMAPPFRPSGLSWTLAEEAAKKHNHGFLRWFLNHPQVSIDPGAVRRCARAAITESHDSRGILGTLQLFEICGYVIHYDEEMLMLAFPGGAAVVEFILERTHLLALHDPMQVYLRAVANGDISILQLLEHRLSIALELSNPLYMATAAEMGHVDMLQFLHDRGCRCDYRVVQFALMNNHIAAAIWALRNNCPLRSTDADVVQELRLREWILAQL